MISNSNCIKQGNNQWKTSNTFSLSSPGVRTHVASWDKWLCNNRWSHNALCGVTQHAQEVCRPGCCLSPCCSLWSFHSSLKWWNTELRVIVWIRWLLNALKTLQLNKILYLFELPGGTNTWVRINENIYHILSHFCTCALQETHSRVLDDSRLKSHSACTVRAKKN